MTWAPFLVIFLTSQSVISWVNGTAQWFVMAVHRAFKAAIDPPPAKNFQVQDWTCFLPVNSRGRMGQTEAHWQRKEVPNPAGMGIRHGAPVAWSNTPSSKCGRVLTSGDFKHLFNIHPYLGKIPILTHIFRRGWLNHQLVLGSSQQTNEYFGTCWSFLQPITWYQKNGIGICECWEASQSHSVWVQHPFNWNIVNKELHSIDLTISKGCLLDWFPKRPTKIQDILLILERLF